eukprot:5055272-Prymnesium_polylepis.1
MFLCASRLPSFAPRGVPLRGSRNQNGAGRARARAGARAGRRTGGGTGDDGRAGDGADGAGGAGAAPHKRRAVAAGTAVGAT